MFSHSVMPPWIVAAFAVTQETIVPYSATIVFASLTSELITATSPAARPRSVYVSKNVISRVRSLNDAVPMIDAAGFAALVATDFTALMMSQVVIVDFGPPWTLSAHL